MPSPSTSTDHPGETAVPGQGGAGFIGSESPIHLVPYDDGYPAGFEDMQRRVPSTQRPRALTGWTPRVELADILTEAIAEASAERAANLAGAT